MIQKQNNNSVYDFVAYLLGAKRENSPSGTSHEYELEGRKVILKYLGPSNKTLSLTYKSLNRINAMIIILDNGSDEYYIYSLDSDLIRINMHQQRNRKPPFGTLSRTEIESKGDLIKTVPINNS